MKAGIGPERIRKQFQEKLVKLDAKIAALEAGIEPFRREREMVMEMLAVHDRHQPAAQADSGEPGQRPADEPPADEPHPMLKVRR